MGGKETFFLLPLPLPESLGTRLKSTPEIRPPLYKRQNFIGHYRGVPLYDAWCTSEIVWTIFFILGIAESTNVKWVHFKRSTLGTKCSIRGWGGAGYVLLRYLHPNISVTTQYYTLQVCIRLSRNNILNLHYYLAMVTRLYVLDPGHVLAVYVVLSVCTFSSYWLVIVLIFWHNPCWTLGKVMLNSSKGHHE